MVFFVLKKHTENKGEHQNMMLSVSSKNVLKSKGYQVFFFFFPQKKEKTKNTKFRKREPFSRESVLSVLKNRPLVSKKKKKKTGPYFSFGGQCRMKEFDWVV